MAQTQERQSQAERRNRSEDVLLDAAAELVAERGVQGASLASIGGRAGVSRGLPTHHFGSKDVLVGRLAERAQSRIGQEMQEAQRSQAERIGDLSALDEVSLTVDAYLEMFEDPTPDQRALLVMWGSTFPSGASVDGMADAERRSYEGLSQLIISGQHDGSVRADVDPIATAVLLHGLMRGLAALRLTDSGLTDMRGVRSACREWILSSLAAVASRTRSRSSAKWSEKSEDAGGIPRFATGGIEIARSGEVGCMRGERKLDSASWILMVAGCVMVMMTSVVGPLSEPAGASDTGSIYQAAATFAGPFTVGHVIEPLTALPTNLAAHNYVEQEFSASGTAHAFRATSAPSDGKWSITPTSSAPYATRILVRRPANPKDFSGTVVVEWMNESAGESAPDWDYLNPQITDAHDAWVGVSAQSLGVDGGKSLLTGGEVTGSVQGLVQQEPQRYGSLHQPGDQYSFDIYDQVAFGLRDSPSAILGPLRPHHILAVGESQSASYLTTFADALEPHDYPYDGIFIHSRGVSGAPLDGGSSISVKTPLLIRTDLRVPVFMSETQTDLIMLGYAPAQQANTNRIRTWEIAGTSHADIYEVGGNASVLGCTTSINTGPQHVVLQAAFADFSRWVLDGTPPPEPARFKLESTNPPTLAVDPHGNVIGGVRTPAVDVPVSTLTGSAPTGTSVICSLFGTTTPFSAAELTSLYGSKSNYISKYTADLDKAITGRYLVPSERTELLTQADQVQFPA